MDYMRNNTMIFLIDPNTRKFLIVISLLYSWSCAPLWYRFVQSHLIEQLTFTKSRKLLLLSNILYYYLFVTILGLTFTATLLLVGWTGILLSIPVFFVVYLIFKGYVYKTSPPSDIEKMSLIVTFIINVGILACAILLISWTFI